MSNGPTVAYFSMEIALESAIPTYSGGLGVLAGDTIRSAADLGLSMTAVSLLHRRGFFRQRLDGEGRQDEQPDPWDPESRLVPVGPRVAVEVEGRRTAIRAWRYDVHGHGGGVVPVYLLDTDLPENHPDDRRLTDDLYLGDARHRLRQEVVLGMGGAMLLEAVSHHPIERFHLNEGHAALAALTLLERFGAGPDASDGALADALRRTRETCVFTTHTPVPAGHDRFPGELARDVLGTNRAALLEAIGLKGELNMTELALACSHFTNGVAVRHGQVSRDLFPGHEIHSITNGVHPTTWTAEPMRALFDEELPDWRRDPLALRYASQLPLAALAQAHRASKQALLRRVRETTGRDLDPDALTLAFARRATGYKRGALIFRDAGRLERIAARHGPIQIVYAGKAHPHDEEGKGLIRAVFAAARDLAGRIEVVYLPNYDMEIGLELVSGSDVWLNNPVPPLEASGTSGMKAALNGVPSLSIADGWWVEGCIEGVTGWEIEDWAAGRDVDASERDARHADALYRKLDEVLAPMYYGAPEQLLRVRRHAISLNGSFFNTHRMVLQYLYEAYRWKQ